MLLVYINNKLDKLWQKGERMEKVQETAETPEVFQNDIELYLSQFCEEHNIEDMTKEPQSRWNAALMYINKYVFGDKSILKLNKNINKNNTNCIMDSNFYMYDYDKLEYILYIYYYLCAVYDKECSIMGYSLLTGINYDTLMDWGAGERKLSTKAFDIVQKLRIFREESLSNKLATGNKNPVGILAILNRHFVWNLPGVSRESTTKVIKTASELPQLSQNNTQLTDKQQINAINNSDTI
nr:MAG: DNA-packaging protein [Bacteriophage sp.]